MSKNFPPTPIACNSTPMRRIARPSRAIDPSYALCASIRQRVSPLPCRSAAATAAFSTTPPSAFLLPGKQDKKKHQQFVRRWQKRLLGDSEPIGAHVDPYDPTSPVRIAPEEQGEYEEVLDEEKEKQKQKQKEESRFPRYLPADTSRGLLNVGGEEWLRQKLEGDMAREFEKLTLRTYTPLTLEMADAIEELTSTPYTLKDENLMMAQTVHQVTGRPYTMHNFGLYRKATTSRQLRSRFAQAVAEVYALKQAGLDMDVSNLANRGVYDVPPWVKDIKLSRTDSGEPTLAFPEHKSLEEFLQAMQTAPAWETVPAEEEELLVEEAEDEAEHVLDPVLHPEQPLIMDPEIPAFKRAAVIKMDPDKKPFDFMSNRPVPRAKLVEEPVVEEPVVEEAAEIQELIPQDVTPAAPPVTEGISEAQESLDHHPATAPELDAALNEQRLSALQERAQRSASDFAALRNAFQQGQPGASAPNVEETQWRKILVGDVALKFALFKRLFQLTGHRISDPQLSSTRTLGDLYNFLCTAAKPQPTSLFAAMHVEGQRARENAKKHAPSLASATTTRPTPSAAKRKPDLGDLINLGNVSLRRVKPTKAEKRTSTGLDKVVQYALWERGLGTGVPSRLGNKGKRVARVGKGVAGKERVFEKVMSSRGANFLAKKTRRWREKEEKMKVAAR
ncbi:hypothetical protein EJ02DRAFT_429807 [Clathrospora elynae]|uniref:Large ribosomal subunit protein mL50 n=1 Tax=Clathrospora elynae TaxID=706981 RepID=A0A6A5T669_9PLEO|nr:hypothetical protein EJ02DRAFT_429807 [Clathrospora elynae]